ncbi:MAG: hypothetical protein K6C97_02345 [Treponema sp.]|nr:hypothetical protein [Treponema sp.]
MEEILQTLTDMNIPFELQEHKAIFSEKDSEGVEITLPGIEVKNLFVKDKHHNYGLVSMDLHKRADLKKIALLFGFDRLSFCNPDELMKYLSITPGSVTPLCIKADKECKVKVLFDQNFQGQKVIVHPLRNTASVSIEFSDLCRFVEAYGHSWITGDVYKVE